MKDSSLSWWVLTADQVHSRRRPDAVPEALEVLSRFDPALDLPFTRTVGDEIQGLMRSGRTMVSAISALTRLGKWRIGVGLGSVELPLPELTAAARGGAYLAARDAVEQARRAPTGLALRVAVGIDVAAPTLVAEDPQPDRFEPAGKIVSASPYGLLQAAGQAETALICLQALLNRRTAEGWQAMDLLYGGLNHRGIAGALGVSEAAVSQRLRRAMKVEVERTQLLAGQLLDAARLAHHQASAAAMTPRGARQ